MRTHWLFAMAMTLFSFHFLQYEVEEICILVLIRFKSRICGFRYSKIVAMVHAFSVFNSVLLTYYLLLIRLLSGAEGNEQRECG